MVTASKHFQSESVMDRLSIALLCNDVVVAQQFSVVCQSKNIDTSVFVGKEIKKMMIDQSKNWYKIFWWIDGSESESDVLSILSMLRARRELSYVLLPQPIHGVGLVPRVLLKAGEVITAVDQRAPYLSVFCYQDLIDGPCLPLEWELEQIVQGVVRPREKYTPILLHDYLYRVLEESLVPRGGQRKVFVGQVELSAEKICQLLSVSLLKIAKNQSILPSITCKKVVVPTSYSEKDIQQAFIGMKAVKVALDRHQRGAAKKLPKPSRRKSVIGSSSAHSRSGVTREEIVEQSIQAVDETVVRLIPQEARKQHESYVIQVKRREVVIPQIQPPVIRRSKLILDSLSNHVTQHQTAIVRQALQHSIQPTPRLISQDCNMQQAATKKHVDIDQRVSQLFAPLTIQHPSTSIPSDVSRKVDVRIHRRALIVGGSVGAMILLCVAFYLVPRYVVERVLNEAVRSSTAIQTKSSLQRLVTNTSLQISLAQAELYSRIMPGGPFGTDKQKAQIASQSLELQLMLAALRGEVILLAHQVLGEGEGSVIEAADRIQSQVDDALRQSSNVEVAVRQMGESGFLQSDDMNVVLRNLKKQLTISQQAIRMFSKLVSERPNATIAVLLQDSNEIRPSGGFLQTVALVTLQSGKIGSVQLLSPTELENGVEAVIAAPSDLAEQLNEDRLFPHDANWFIDFNESSQKIRWFIEKSHGIMVDGVVAVNASLLRELLQITGEMQVGGVIVGTEGLQDQLYARSDESLQGEGVGNDFFSKVFAAVLGYKKIDESEYFNIMSSLSRLLEQGEIQINATEPSIQAQLRTLGWDGRVVQPICPTQFSENRCEVSTVYQLDSNIGLNKVGKFIKKKHQHSVEFKLDQTLHKHYLTYENYIRVSTWPGGDFSNYVRFALPRTAELLSVRIGSNQIELDQVDSQLSDRYVVIGFPITVPIQSSTEVEVIYKDQPIRSGESFAFFWQRQAGVGVTPLDLEMRFAEGMIPTMIAPEAGVAEGIIKFSFAGNQHVFAAVTIQ